jgi:hypothetical protein
LLGVVDKELEFLATQVRERFIHIPAVKDPMPFQERRDAELHARLRIY